MTDQPKPLYEQLLFLHETTAQHIEKTEEDFAVGISFLQQEEIWEALSHEEQANVSVWLNQIQSAKAGIRGLQE